MKYFPDNTLANFKTHLHKPLDLGKPGAWEVGVSEVHYPHNWYYPRVTSPHLGMEVKVYNFINPHEPKLLGRTRFGGKFSSITHLIEKLKKNLTEDYVEFKWSEEKQRVQVVIKPDTMIYINENLKQALGMLPEENTWEQTYRGQPAINKKFLGRKIAHCPPP